MDKKNNKNTLKERENLVNRKKEAMNINLFFENNKSFNSIVMAASGSGKSYYFNKKEIERLEKEKQKKKINKILDNF